MRTSNARHSYLLVLALGMASWGTVPSPALAQVLISVDDGPEDQNLDRTVRGALRTPSTGGASSSGATDTPVDTKELKNRWDNLNQQWNNEVSTHEGRLKQIQKNNPPGPKRDALINQENARHRQQSKDMAVKRDAIHNDVISEANRRASGGTTEASKKVRQTAGTPVTSDAHRGMTGDGDYGGGSRNVDKVQEVLGEMGIKSTRKGGTLETDGAFGMTVNKEGKMGRPGTAAHQTQVNVDARNHETYVSEGMAPDQPGRDYVAVQDHKKKALGGLTSKPDDLVGKTPAGQSMAKGAQKSIHSAGMSDAEIKKIMAANGIDGSVEDFKQNLADVKEGRKGFQSADEAAKMQNASRDIINKAEAKTRERASSEIADTKKQIEALESSGQREAAQDLREKLVDSNTKIKETSKANTELESDYKSGRQQPATPDTGRQSTPEVEGPDRTVAPETPKGPDVEGPGGRTTAGGPEAPTGKTGTGGGDEAAGALGKAGKAIGTGMQIIDVGSTLADMKADVEKGDYASAAIRGLEFGADELTSGMYSANKKILGSDYDQWQADRATERANEMEAEGFNLESAKKLLDKGVSREEVNKLIAEKNSGNEGPLYDKFRELKVQPPKWTNHEYEQADDTFGERVKAFGDGLAENAKKTGGLIHDTANDAAFGAGKMIYGSPDDVKIAKETMIESLVKDGATPEGAEKAASAYYDKGDKQMLERLKEILDKRNGITREPKDLRDAEGTMEDGAEDKIDKDTTNQSVLGQLADARNQKNADKTRDAMGNMSANSQLEQGSTAGDQETKEAKNKINQAGEEAQDKQDQTSKQVAKGDQKEALGNKLKDSFTEGLASGGVAAGTAVGNAAAEKTAGAVFGNKKKSSGSKKGSGNDSGKTTGVTGQKTAGGGSKTAKTGGGKGSGGKGKKTTGKDGEKKVTSGSSTNAPASTGKTATRNCPQCGQAMTPIVIPPDPSKLEDYRWTCDGCGLKDSNPVSSANTTVTPPAPSSPPPPPPPPKPEGHKCPGCSGAVTDSDWYMSNYGPAIHCPHCKGAIKVGWYPSSR